MERNFTLRDLEVNDDVTAAMVAADNLDAHVAMSRNGLLSEAEIAAFLRKTSELIFTNFVRDLYFIVKEHPVQFAKQLQDVTREGQPETIRDYHNRIYLMKKAAVRLKKKIDQVGFENLHIDEAYIESLDGFIGFTSAVENISKNMSEIVEVGNTKSDHSYCKTLKQNLKIIDNSLTKTGDYILFWGDYTDRFDYVDFYDNSYEYFEFCSNLIKDLLDSYFKSVKESNVSRREPVIVYTQKEPVVRAEDKQVVNPRLDAIKTANELYDRFQVDFMRDLEKEVSMMNRDSYEALLDKVEKFLKKFPMPLSKDVSMGMATEAQAQINKFINTVYEISRNTYTPVVFNRE